MDMDAGGAELGLDECDPQAATQPSLVAATSSAEKPRPDSRSSSATARPGSRARSPSASRRSVSRRAPSMWTGHAELVELGVAP
ncbi:hypothetical protein [Nonomuraea sp. NPDC003709]|uniref:hypothetical protein n=1 Tax=Nonomuraea sp. NPDC003709 TaxID=3154450 RepID=UPI0033A4E184